MHRFAFLLVNLALIVFANNINPGGRSHGGSWMDSESNLWIFGGWGFDASGQEGFLNDVWMFSPGNNSWHWIGGSRSISAYGVYNGTNQIPGARESPMIWITPNRKTVFMFGGYGYAKEGPLGYLQDMWHFDIATRVWTFVKGSDTINGGSNFAATPDATPSARYRSAVWSYNATLFFLFGGAQSTSMLLNDVWMYDAQANVWAFIGGSSNLNWLGTYGTTESTSNIPGGRVSSSTWKDNDNMFWLFGGNGYASVSGQSGYLNDVWRFNPMTRGWTFIAGSATINPAGNFGVFGVASGGVPSPRLSSVAWFDKSANEAVIFGGGDPNYFSFGCSNDVWRFRPATKDFIWVGGDPIPGQLGRFGDLRVPSKYNIPSSRISSYIGQSDDNAYLFGGAHLVYGRSGDIVRLNDMWHLHLPTDIWTWLDGTQLPNQRGIYDIPNFTILTLPSYLSGNIHLEDRFTHEQWSGSFIKNSAGSNWNVSAIITNLEKRASLIYADGALVLREDNSDTVSCVDPSEVLSDDVVGAAVKSAIPLPDSYIKDLTVLACVGTKWEVNVLQEIYVVCREDKTRDWKIFGVNFAATLTDLVSSPGQSKKRNVELDSSLFSGLFNCSKAENEIPPKVEAIKWYTRDWKNVENKKFECIFLHGEGVDATRFPSNNPTLYWRNIGEFTPQCASKKFSQIDTLRRGWTDPSLQQDFCELVTGNRTGGEAQNKLIFAHSMANLVLGAAIKNNYCKLGNTAYWYNIQGPNQGSQIVGVLEQACGEEGINFPVLEFLLQAALAQKGIPYSTGTIATSLRTVLELSGYCKQNKLYPAYASLIPTSMKGPQEFADVLETIQNNVHGGMCGSSSVGLISWDSSLMALLHGVTVAWKEGISFTSDGFVPLESCQAFTKDVGKFSPSFTSTHYLAGVNNQDGRCLRSDGWWGVHRKPCLWYANQGLIETGCPPGTTVSSGYIMGPASAVGLVFFLAL